MNKDRRSVSRYFVGLLASIFAFTIINYLHFHRPVTCVDCRFPYGLPFTIYHEGGYAGDTGFVWSAILGNLLVIVAVGIAIGWFLKKIFQLRSSGM